jgi:hypothetical protein
MKQNLRNFTINFYLAGGLILLERSKQSLLLKKHLKKLKQKLTALKVKQKPKDYNVKL